MSKKKIILNDVYKRFTLDQDKSIPPNDTIDQFKEKLKRIDLDILEEAVRIDNGRLDIPVFFSKCGKDALEIIGTKKQMGKGATPSQAEASAVMELAERFSFFSFCKDDRNFFTEKAGNVKNAKLSFDFIAKSVHDKSEDLDISEKIFNRVPLKWTQAYNMTREELQLVPFSWFFTINEFNGPSAGNCAEEALLQGICEIVERHVSSLVSQNQINAPGIRSETATDKMVMEMLDKYKQTGIKVYLTDFTLGMGIPSVGVLAWDPSTFPDRSEIVWTAGTTPDPEKALSRALTEVAQLAGDFNSGSNYVASGLPKPRSLKEVEYITDPQKRINMDQLPNISDNNMKIEVGNCISSLAQKGFEVLFIDTMHPLLEIPAFYTIVPGAHFRERAVGTSVAMFSAKIITETLSPPIAIKELKAINDMLPNKYYVHFYIGQSLLSMNDPESALKYFYSALDLEPTDQDIPSIYSYLGVCLKEMERYQQALEILEKGNSYDNERTDIHNLKGFCYFKLKKHTEAIESFKRVLELDPSSAIDYANIGSNYRELGEIEKAIRYYELSLEMDPSIGFALENVIRLRNKIKKP